MLINRPSVADEQPVVQEQAQVIVLKSKGDSDDAIATETLNTTLHEKLEGLPEELQQKLRAKLEAFKKDHAGAVRVEGKKLIVSAREKADGDQAGSEPKHVVVTVVPSEGKAEATAVVRAHAIVVNDGEKSQTFTIKVDDGKVQVNGEPVKVDADKKSEQKHVHVYTVRVDSDGTKETGPTLTWQAQAPEHQAAHKQVAAAVKLAKATPAQSDVAKRLANIEKELKQIRKLLEEMQKREAE
jgi:hypothetical protein